MHRLTENAGETAHDAPLGPGTRLGVEHRELRGRCHLRAGQQPQARHLRELGVEDERLLHEREHLHGAHVAAIGAIEDEVGETDARLGENEGRLVALVLLRQERLLVLPDFVGAVVVTSPAALTRERGQLPRSVGLALRELAEQQQDTTAVAQRPLRLRERERLVRGLAPHVELRLGLVERSVEVGVALRPEQLDEGLGLGVALDQLVSLALRLGQQETGRRVGERRVLLRELCADNGRGGPRRQCKGDRSVPHEKLLVSAPRGHRQGGAIILQFPAAAPSAPQQEIEKERVRQRRSAGCRRRPARQVLGRRPLDCEARYKARCPATTLENLPAMRRSFGVVAQPATREVAGAAG